MSISYSEICNESGSLGQLNTGRSSARRWSNRARVKEHDFSNDRETGEVILCYSSDISIALRTKQVHSLIVVWNQELWLFCQFYTVYDKMAWAHRVEGQL